MPVYQYKALDQRGEPTQGSIDASSPREAREKLRGRKLFVTDMAAAKGGRKGAIAKADSEADMPAVGGGPGGGGGLQLDQLQFKRLFLGRSRAELPAVTRLLATLLKAGITLVDSISSLIQQVEDQYLNTVLREIRESVQGGVSFADALAMHPELFDPLYVNMVRAGEASGALDQVLHRLANFMQAQHRMKNRVSAALTYPLIMMVLGFGVVIFPRSSPS